MGVVKIVYIGTWTKWEVAIWHKPEVISGVTIHGLNESHDKPQPESLDVCFEENWAKEEREGVA